MHQLVSIIQQVEKTHPNLGNAVAFGIVTAKARKCLLVVSPAGCGKSSISDAIGKAYPQTVRLDSVTRSGLRDFKDDFTNFHGLVVIDDLGKVDSDYSRKHTVSSFAELCYSHFISKHTMTVTIEIGEFYGSSILNIQPVIMSSLVEDPEWEAVTQDKTVRYYHLYRPIKPYSSKPDIKVDWGIDLDLIHKPSHDFKVFAELDKIGSIQWSDARVLEHLDDLLKAVAALDRRQDVIASDLILLRRLMRPMAVEGHIMNKSGFESGRWLNSDLLAVLVEFASWKNISVARIARDYKISESTVYRLLVGLKDWFTPKEPMSKRIVPKPELKQLLKDVGVER